MHKEDDSNTIRNYRLWRWGALVAVLWSGSVGGSPPDSRLAVGQEWSIRAPTESTARVIIGRIEPWKDKIAVHVSIIDIPVSKEAGALRVTQIAHAPFEKSAFEASTSQLVATGVAPAGDFETGYKQWKEHSGGLYSLSVDQVIKLAQAVRTKTN